MKKLLTTVALLSCPALFGQTFNGGGGAISDYQTVSIPVLVSGLPSLLDTMTFGLEQVCISLDHTYDGDLAVSLTAPDGTLVGLLSGVGGDGDNFTNTCFRADAPQTIASGTAPFTGIFEPTGQIGLVNDGQNGNGSWAISVYDGYGGDEGSVISCSLTFGNDPAGYFSFTESDLPIVVISTGGQAIQNEPKVMADLGIIYNGPGNRNHLSDPANDYNGKAGIEIRGNYSASLPQKPYAVELWDVNGTTIDAPLLGMPEESDWVLLANYNDKSFARNILPFRLFGEMGHYSVRTRLVDVVLNGEYQGIYLLGEKIKRDSNRVDISKLEPAEIAGQDMTGGYIVKIDYWNSSDSWQLEHSPIGYPGLDIHMVYYYPKPEEIVPQQKDYIQAFIGAFEDQLYGPDFDDPETGYRQFINTGSFVDYFIVNEVARNVDGFKKSRFFWKDKDHANGDFRKLRAGPVWDFDWAFKDIGFGEDGSGWMYSEVAQDVNAPGWYIRLLQDPIFADELRCRYDDLRRNLLSEEYLFARIDSVAALVNESQEWHYAVWGNMGQATGTPESEAPSQTYAEEVQRLKDWLHRRFVWLDENMPGTLNGCSMSGVAELSASATLVAYPNPFTGTLKVEWPGGDLSGASLVLRDQSGREVQQTEAATGAEEAVFYDLGKLAAGVYFIGITKNGESRVLKVVK
jgi:hypothetical protein